MTLLFFSSVPVGFIPQTDPNERKLSTGPPVESSHYNNHFFLHQMTAVVATAKIPEKYALYSITMMLRSNKHCGGIHKLCFRMKFLFYLYHVPWLFSFFRLFNKPENPFQSSDLEYMCTPREWVCGQKMSLRSKEYSIEYIFITYFII